MTLKGLKASLTLGNAAALAMLLFFIGVCSSISVQKSNTWDESAHMLAGYAYLKEGADYLSPLHHPAFGRLITGVLPLVFLNPDYRPDRVTPEQAKDSNFFPYSVKFIFENTSPGTRILFLSRLGVTLVAALLGLYVFIWSNELWGVEGGLLSLFLFILCPNVLAHSSLATTDMPITAFFFITMYYIYSIASKGVSGLSASLTGLFFTLALTSKHTALLLLPFIAVAFLMNIIGRPKDEALRSVFWFIFLVVFVYVGIWTVYGFRYRSESAYYQPLFWDALAKSKYTPLFDLLRRIRFLPEAYLYSLAGVLFHTGEGHAAFLMGEYSSTGWWYYFIVAYLIKTPVPALILLIAALLYLFRGSGKKRDALFLVLPVALIFAAFSKQKVNIGLRHVLPAFPFIYALIGFVPSIKTERRGLAKAVFYGLLLWYFVSFASIYPHQLAYFNEFIGGPKNGYKYLLDSNLDWGQDLPGLKKYMDKNNIATINLSYFGLSNPQYYGINYSYLPSYEIPNPMNVRDKIELKGYFAISATMLQGVYLSDRDFYAFFKQFKPIDTIGYSIFIYKF